MLGFFKKFLNKYKKQEDIITPQPVYSKPSSIAPLYKKDGISVGDRVLYDNKKYVVELITETYTRLVTEDDMVIIVFDLSEVTKINN